MQLAPSDPEQGTRQKPPSSITTYHLHKHCDDCDAIVDSREVGSSILESLQVTRGDVMLQL